MYVSRFVVAKMVKEHVYSDPDWLTGDRLEAKLIDRDPRTGRQTCFGTLRDRWP